MFKSVSLAVVKFSPATVCCEKPMDFFSLEIPRAVTTTSSKALSATRVTLTVAEDPIVTF